MTDYNSPQSHLPQTKNIFLNLYSINIRGLARRDRGELILNEIMNSRHNIIFIQETHVYNPTQINRLNKIWKGQIFWDEGSFNSRGVAILVKDTVPIKISQIRTSGKGQYIVIHATIQEKKFRFVNIYFPHTNQERITIIEELRTFLPTETNIILAGDFNFVENPKLDKLGGNTAQAISTRNVFELLTQ
jgi:endonuclease/exonuclease/phosphatase family metal-dependent hydrolase